MQATDYALPKPLVDDLDEALVSICQGDDPPGYQRDPADDRAAKGVRGGIFDDCRNWCHDD